VGLGERGGAVLKAVLCRPCFAIRETADLRIDMRHANGGNLSTISSEVAI